MDLQRPIRRIKREVNYYRKVSTDPRTPAISRYLLAAALAYLLSPIDLIPDFIPIVGHLDDLIIVGGLVLLARLFVPNVVLMHYRKHGEENIVTHAKDDQN